MKYWWQSRTLRFNILSGLVMTLQALSDTNVIPSEYMAPALAVGNIWLRFITSEAIG